MVQKHNYLKSAGVIGLSTLASRILGMIRDMAMASLFGAGMILDAFVLAFSIPNLFRRFLGEGALAAAFIPAFTEVLDKEGKEKGRSLVNRCGTLLLLLLLFLVLLGITVCLLPTLLADLEPKNLLALRLCALMMPFLLLICWTAFLGAILNALHHFWASAFSPALFNMIWIGGIFLLAPLFGSDRVVWAYVMAFAVLLGGLAQILLCAPFLRTRDMSFSVDTKIDRNDPTIRKIFINLIPVLFSAAIVQIDTFLASCIAWFLIPGDGAITILYMANRLLQFPLSIIGTSLGTVVFPIFSLYAVRGEKERFAKAVPEALRIAFFLALPATLGLIVLAKPLVFLIYQRNHFSTESALRTANVLAIYCGGLCFYILLQILSRAFYATGDTKTPTWVSFYVLGAGILVNILLAPYLYEIGLALTAAMGAALQATLLLYFLHKKSALVWAGTFRFFWKVALSAFLMSVCVSLTSSIFSYQGALKERFLSVVVPLLVGIGVYAGSAWIFGIEELKRFISKK